MSRLAQYLKTVLRSRNWFPTNLDWDNEARIVAAHIFAGTDQEFFDNIERELLGE